MRIKSGKIRFGIALCLSALLFSPSNLYSQDDALFRSAMSNNIDSVKELLKSGADINQQNNNYGYTPLLMACELGYREMAELLISEGADISLKGNNGATALILAARTSQPIATLLLSKGADINARSDNGTGVMTNCVAGIISGRVTLDMAEILVKAGAEIDEENTNDYVAGQTPLFMAAGEDNPELVGFLIDNGANLNAKSKKGKTPLSIAVESGNTRIADLLRANGAK